MAAAEASLLRRLQHPTTILHAGAGCLPPLELASCLTTVAGNRPEHALFLGATERVASRLLASRVPEPLVKKRRRLAQKKAQNKGSTPSQAHLDVLAWHRLSTKVPTTRWQTATVGKVSPLRWQLALMFTSWKRYLP